MSIAPQPSLSFGARDTYQLDSAGHALRLTTRRDGRVVTCRLPLDGVGPLDDPAATFDAAWLRAQAPPDRVGPALGVVRIVDLFSGCGAMSLGASDAALALGLEAEHVLAVDIDAKAVAAYAHNFPEVDGRCISAAELLDSPLGAPPSASERALAESVGAIDLLIGGPPCQGHSDLNNHTRRNDPKNALYLTMARFAEVVRPRAILIENVPGARHDKSGVVGRTRRCLKRLGYSVSSGVLDAAAQGVAQRRKRFLLAASLDHRVSMDAIQPRVAVERPLEFAISDLVDVKGDTTYDSWAVHSATNRARIQYLFEHDLYNLPNAQRPACHRDKPHSYVSVYGRMHWDRPAQTLTTGFGSTGRGRFVHPLRPRTLTPHEAARVQFIPDFFRFEEKGRWALQVMVGNAVPPRLAYAAALELLA
ncbi:MAG: DNA (cytosine-5)-methyltransferase 1 [Myxococcota bacterium]|jgi:DNA (cytosine-5)-methyltransferase 1